MPEGILGEIYALLGLRRSYSLDMNRSYGLPRSAWQQEICRVQPRASHNQPCSCSRCFPPLNQLFFVFARRVRMCALVFFYLENKFKISDGGMEGLSPLMDLTPVAMDALHSIEVRIGTQTCSFVGDDGCHGTSSTILFKDKTFFEDMGSVLQDWRQICFQLSRNIDPDWLILFLCSGAASEKTANAIFKPLLQLPTLDCCSIRLGPYTDPALQKLVVKTVRQLTWTSNPKDRPVRCSRRIASRVSLGILRPCTYMLTIYLTDK